MLKNASFIEFPKAFCPEYRTEDPAPLFRRRFTVGADLQKATLAVCGLGYGLYWLDGQPVTADRFTAPVSDYNKTLWYTVYSLTDRLAEGGHLLAAMLGNGFYNESLKTAWDFNKAPWRGLPKLLLTLELVYPGHTDYIYSDQSWVCCEQDSPVRFNQLRSGEIYDARYAVDWMQPGYDDSHWQPARLSSSVPAGILRECTCQPVREMREYAPVSVFQNAGGYWVLDFGQNMSGYLRLTIDQPAGDRLTVLYSEELRADGTRNTNGMDDAYFYAEGRFQKDEILCGGRRFTYTPSFVYHGFRYALIDGLRQKPKESECRAVFVHQAVEELSDFACSDPLIHQLYQMGKMSTLSNLFYMVTDCPTREKLGWANDAAASAEQMLLNYNMAPLYKKWMQDIYDAMREDGFLPGIIPTGGWGYDWGSGPISNAVLYELPYQIWRYTDDSACLCASLPWFRRYLDYAAKKRDAHGLIGFGLCDWAGPFEKPGQAPTPLPFTDTLLVIKFCRITALVAKLAGEEKIRQEAEGLGRELKESFCRMYVEPETGRSRIHEQTAVAMLIGEGIYTDLQPLKQQLRETVEEKGWHLHCGMLGIQYLYPALDLCHMQEDAYRIITAHGRPGYREWIENGATTMWEMYSTEKSKNHHMNSCVMMWFVKSLLGLRQQEGSNAFRRLRLTPSFLPALDSCRGSFLTASGAISLQWQRQETGEVLYTVALPEGVTAQLELQGYAAPQASAPLSAGTHSIRCVSA